MNTALTNCPSCGAPLDRSATSCSRCGTPIIKSGGEQASQAISSAGDAVKKTAPTGAAVAIHLSGLVGVTGILAWLWLIPLVCAFLTEGHILRTHSRVWWRWCFDWLGTSAACVVPIYLIAVVITEFVSEVLAVVFFVPGALLILALVGLYIINGIKAAMAASDGIVYTYPKLLLSKFGIL